MDLKALETYGNALAKEELKLDKTILYQFGMVLDPLTEAQHGDLAMRYAQEAMRNMIEMVRHRALIDGRVIFKARFTVEKMDVDSPFAGMARINFQADTI